LRVALEKGSKDNAFVYPVTYLTKAKAQIEEAENLYRRI
jgi:hypothetical protein